MDFNATLISELGPFIYGKTSWLEYQNKMETFFDEHDVWGNERKRDVCVSMIGVKCLKILKILIRPQNVQDVDYETVLSKLESHFYPKLTHVHYSFKFNNRKQRKREDFFEYIIALRKLMINCIYDDPEVQLKRQIIIGVRHDDLREKFHEKNNLSLTRLFEIGLAYDDSKALKGAPHPRNHKARINRDKTCFRCKESILRKHKNENCPFEWADCEHCNIKGHLSTACKYKDLLCNYCSQKGHISKICVRKAEDSKGPRPITVSVTTNIIEDEDKNKEVEKNNNRFKFKAQYHRR
ncbi:hypothetical protein NQ314_014083 [Rhamnusium bicolor]|uniref:CCHC-type domain-containing protein n=1 Tax=Rhamnusium bicolor TaxID=1586634 RepID=A0AAV8X455_9CUCU|nr:hypothetical protein NQ314_014083 [Rhamnusium bicolor]